MMTKNSYGFCYIVLNAGTYLYYSLESIAKLMLLNPDSQIIIVEAADAFSHTLEKTQDGLSIDGTADIIEHFQSLYPGRINYEQLGQINDKRESRNRCLEIARYSGLNISHIFNVDGDELIKPDDFIKMDTFIEENQNHLVFWLQQYLFWGDFQTRYTDKFGGFKEIIFSNCHNLHYNWWHTQISLGENRFNVLMPDSTAKLDFPYYHYGHICPKYRLFMKRLYSLGQIRWFNDNVQPISLWQGNDKVWGNFFKGQPWESNHWAEVDAVANTEHPPEILLHPWFGMTKEEIWEQQPYQTFLPEKGVTQ